MTNSYAALGMLVAAGLLLLNTVDVALAQRVDVAALQRDYRRPPPRPVENQHLVNLGRDLFFEPRISASGKTSCAGCHYPELGWVVTDARSRNDSGKLTSRKSQPLIGLGHALNAPVGWDGRSATLEAQAKASIATGSMSMRETDMPVKVEVIEERIRSAPDYVAKFNAALPGAPINIDTIAQSIAAFERTIEPEIAPFDRWVSGEESAISEMAKRGLVLFAGKATCFVCHSGWRFTDDKFHDIGTTSTDQGRGREIKDDKLNYAFKTPTLRSVALRAPYMHNASISNLYDVVRHFEKGGIDRPSRSPMMSPLQLSEQERLASMARLPSAPDIPTADEAGLPKFFSTTWYGLWAPKNTPKDIIAKLNAAVLEALNDPSVRTRLSDQGLDMPPRELQTPEALGAFHKTEIQKWWPIIRQAGIKPYSSEQPRERT